ncbi:MAG: STAS domain-containing protein [Atopobiaceae bacterium]|nr:STAS domain-containing protein [Atopobiaceae bacterium]
MSIITKTEDNTTTIALFGWLDASAAPKFAAAVAAVGQDTTKLVVDFKELEYICSAGLRQLVTAHKKMSGNLVIINASTEVREVLHMAGFDRRLNIA